MKHIHYDNSGKILGFYEDEIHDLIPTPNIKIGEETWRDCVDNQGLRIIKNRKVIEYTPPPPPLDDIKKEVRERFRVETQERITGGMTSSALGTPHEYQTAVTDQLNLSAHLLSSLQPDTAADATWSIWCRNGEGEAERREHSIAQIRHLASDLEFHIDAAQAAHAQALSMLESATTIDEVDAERDYLRNF